MVNHYFCYDKLLVWYVLNHFGGVYAMFRHTDMSILLIKTKGTEEPWARTRGFEYRFWMGNGKPWWTCTFSEGLKFRLEDSLTFFVCSSFWILSFPKSSKYYRIFHDMNHPAIGYRGYPHCTAEVPQHPPCQVQAVRQGTARPTSPLRILHKQKGG